jgi:hypothetical protein
MTKRDDETTGVHFSGPTNSTKFTDCCETAICDYQDACPRCGRIVPLSPRGRHNMAMRKQRGLR